MELLTLAIVLSARCFSQASQNTSDSFRKDLFEPAGTNELAGNKMEPSRPHLTHGCSGALGAFQQGTGAAVTLDLPAEGRNKMADEICESLGCGGAYEIRDGTAPDANGTCLTACTYRDSRLHNCTEAAQRRNCSGVTELVCGHQVVRLAGGRNRCEGRVELWQAGQWGTVCDDEWHLGAGAVVCAQLGCGSALRVTGEGAVFGAGAGPIHLGGLNCTGTEDSLWRCGVLRSGNSHYCGHKEDSGVVCAGSTDAPSLSNATDPETPAWTTEPATSVVVEASRPGLSAAVLGCIALTLALLLVLTSNAMLCLCYRRRRACVIHQRHSSSHTAVMFQPREQADSGGLLRVTTDTVPRDSRRSPELVSDDTSSCESDYMNYDLHAQPTDTMANLYIEAPAGAINSSTASRESLSKGVSDEKSHTRAIRVASIDSDSSTSSGECYQNVDADKLLKSVASIDSDSSTSSGECYQNVDADKLLKSVASIDSDRSTSSGECYQNVGGDADTLLKSDDVGHFPPEKSLQSPPPHNATSVPKTMSWEATPSLPGQVQQAPRNHGAQETGNSPGYSSYLVAPDAHNHADGTSSTSSGELYENVPETDEEEEQGASTARQDPAESSSDSDYDDVSSYEHFRHSPSGATT